MHRILAAAALAGLATLASADPAAPVLGYLRPATPERSLGPDCEARAAALEEQVKALRQVIRLQEDVIARQKQDLARQTAELERRDAAAKLDLPDLKVLRVDLKRKRVTLVNAGRARVRPGEPIYLSWSEGWYAKNGWNSMSLVGQGPLEPGETLEAEVFGNLDAGTQFGLDVDRRILESEEDNNCADVNANPVPCRVTQ